MAHTRRDLPPTHNKTLATPTAPESTPTALAPTTSALTTVTPTAAAVATAAVATASLARCPSGEIHGGKGAWRPALLVQPFGHLAHTLWGCRS